MLARALIAPNTAVTRTLGATVARRCRRLPIAMAAAAPGGGGNGGGGLGEHGSWDWRQQQQQQSGASAAAAAVNESDKQFAPAASRNEAPILAALTEHLQAASYDGDGDAAAGRCLVEVACGTGQHAAAFSRALIGAGLLDSYLPTDLTSANFGSVRAHAAGVPGLLPPRVLDASLPPERWFDGDSPPPLRAMLAVNLTHISPWPATVGLLRGAARHLHPHQGLLMIYGPFTRQGGQHVGEGDGNARFDTTLRAQDPGWGYRDVDEEVVPAALEAGLELVAVQEMPANNLFLVLRRQR